MVFRVASGGGSSELVIGAGATPITGGTASRVLFEDGTAALAQSANLTFNGTVLTVLSGGTNTQFATGNSTIANIPSWWATDGMILSGGAAIAPVLRIANSAGVMYWYTSGSTPAAHWSGVSGSSLMKFDSKTTIGWTATQDDPTGALDSGFSRISAGLIGVGTGAAGSTAGSLSMNNCKAVSYTVGTTAGLASFNGAVTNITVVNGIVTAAS